MTKPIDIKTWQIAVVYTCHGEGVIHVLARTRDQALDDVRKLLASRNSDTVPVLVEGPSTADITDSRIIDIHEIDGE